PQVPNGKKAPLRSRAFLFVRFDVVRKSVSRRERLALSREFLRQRVEIPRQLRNASIVLLQIGGEVGALGAGERDSLDLDIGDGGCAILGPAHTEAHAARRTRKPSRIGAAFVGSGLTNSVCTRESSAARSDEPVTFSVWPL